MTKQIELVRLAYVPGGVERDTVDRVGGDPIGVTKETWPTHEGAPLIHVLTLSQHLLVPTLAAGAEAIAVFSSDPALPGGGECRVVFLSREDLARGTTRSEDVWGRPIRAGDAGRLVAQRDTYAHDAEADEYGGLSGFFDRQRNSEIEGAQVIGFSGSHVYFGYDEDEQTPKGHSVLFWLHCAYEVGPFSFGDANWYVSANERETKVWERF